MDFNINYYFSHKSFTFLIFIYIYIYIYIYLGGFKLDQVPSRRNSIYSQSSSLSPHSLTSSPTPPKGSKKDILPRSDFIDASLNRKSGSSEYTNPETDITLESSIIDYNYNRNIMMKKSNSVRYDGRELDGDKIIDNHMSMSATSMRTDREENDLSMEHSPEYSVTHTGMLQGGVRGRGLSIGNNQNENNQNQNNNQNENENENENINKDNHFNIDINMNINKNIHRNESIGLDGNSINYSLGNFSPEYNGSQNQNQNQIKNQNQCYNHQNPNLNLNLNQHQNQNQNEVESESSSAISVPSSSLTR